MDDVSLLATVGFEEEAAALMFMDFKTHRRSAIFELNELTDSQCYDQFISFRRKATGIHC